MLHGKQRQNATIACFPASWCALGAARGVHSDTGIRGAVFGGRWSASPVAILAEDAQGAARLGIQDSCFRQLAGGSASAAPLFDHWKSQQPRNLFDKLDPIVRSSASCFSSPSLLKLIVPLCVSLRAVAWTFPAGDVSRVRPRSFEVRCAPGGLPRAVEVSHP